ncbi:MAG: alkaline phosphatase family protein, partial [Solirubrobacterales bacterium]
GIRWSFCRDLCKTRVIVMDNRGGRVLEPEKRAIFNDHEREWVWDKAKGDFDHLLIGASDPFLLTQSFHWLEAWNEKVVELKAWGPLASKVGEKMRRSVDFDHWSAFGFSFDKMTEFLRSAGSGEWGEPPATIVVLSGDVHHAYLADMAFRKADGVKSAVYQAVCSPFRNPLDANERRVIRLATTKPVQAITRALAKAAGVPDPGLRWRFLEGPYFDNQVATLHIDGRKAELTLEKTKPGETEEESLETSFTRRLA